MVLTKRSYGNNGDNNNYNVNYNGGQHHYHPFVFLRWSKDHMTTYHYSTSARFRSIFRCFSHVFLRNTAGEQDMWCKKWWETSRRKPHTLQAVGSLPAGHVVPENQNSRDLEMFISSNISIKGFNPSWCRWNVPFLQMTWVNFSMLTWEKKSSDLGKWDPLDCGS